MIQVHGTCVELAGLAVLLRGAPGSGKSDLALRLIDQGARLVADDRVDLRLDGTELLASAPPPLAGRIEVRGLGILALPPLASARLGLVVELVDPATVERLPEPSQCSFLGRALPQIRLAPFESSAAAKLRLAVRALRQTIMTAT
jgi:HPr kinase/phosphorylase